MSSTFRIHKGRGDLVKFTVVIDRSKFRSVDDEYNPAQRRVINAQLAKADADIKAGRGLPSF